MARIKIEFSDEVSSKLAYLAKQSPKSLNRCLTHAITSVKGVILKSELRTFGKELIVKDENQKTKATRYKKTGKTRFKLTVHPRFQILEKGGDIFPKNKPYLHFYSEEKGWTRTDWVTIPKRPFFKQGLRAAIQEDVINKSIEQSMKLEYKRMGLKYKGV